MTAERSRQKIEIRGAVQGVGFRPFVFRLASELGLTGQVGNDTRGVRVEAQGSAASLGAFVRRLRDEAPSAALVEEIRTSDLAPRDESVFRIEASSSGGSTTVQISPDLATCRDCLRELCSRADRRYGYPFINCTQCGPRFSIVESLPYDRPRTTMHRFVMCEDCRREYEDPASRRFHAQPNACPVCGPRIALWDGKGVESARGREAIASAVEALNAGEIVAVKGLGGFHLMLDARDEAAVRRLRASKPRREKPLALMVRDLTEVARLCRVDPGEARLLSDPSSPIVLLRRDGNAPVAGSVAPGNPYLGVMLPYTPLHHLLFASIDFPLVATSGNLEDEPICTDEREAGRRLSDVADRFLVHDRPIARHVDDSVVWSVVGEGRLLRRARGFAPRPVRIPRPIPPVLALGAQLKNAVALGVEGQVFVSQHIGDMESPEAVRAFERVVDDFLRLYRAEPRAIAHDLHPDYAATRWAAEENGRFPGVPRVAVQHHHAHLASCLTDNGCGEPALGAIWDGTGYGTDGAVWGGEFLLGDARTFTRVAHLRPFRLPGGEAAVREPRRVALSLLWELEGERCLRRDLPSIEAFSDRERDLLATMLARDVRCVPTTSMGRLFDGVASLLGLVQRNAFEGQGAMALEFAAEACTGAESSYPVDISPGSALIDWGPTLTALLEDSGRGVDVSRISARFHGSMARLLSQIARQVGEPRVALSGGCFQNRRLVEAGVAGLREAGHEVLLHRQVPPGDGGIALGQVAVAAAVIG